MRLRISTIGPGYPLRETTGGKHRFRKELLPLRRERMRISDSNR